MATLQVRNGSYRILFCHGDRRHSFTIGKVDPREAELAAAAAEAWARSKGCGRMAFDAIVDNTDSIEAHARLGYHEVGRPVHFAKDLG